MKLLLILTASLIIAGCSYQKQNIEPRSVYYPVQPTPTPTPTPTPLPPPKSYNEEPEIETAIPESYILYSASWCGPCKDLKRRLESYGVAYINHDVELNPPTDPDIASMVANGVPVVVNPDGTIDRGEKIRAKYN